MGKSKDLATGETRFVNTSGDSMTGALSVSGGANSAHLTLSGSANRGLKISTSNPDGQNDGTVILNAQDTEASGVYAKMAFQTAGTDRMKIDNVGRVTKPNQPHMLASNYKERYGSTDRHIFHYVNVNTGNHWNNTNGKFTCPVNGVYLVTAFSGYKQTATYAGIGIGYNGAVLSYGWSPNNDSRHGHQNVTIMKNASANDYFYYFAHTSHTTPISSAGEGHHSHFSVYLLG